MSLIQQTGCSSLSIKSVQQRLLFYEDLFQDGGICQNLALKIQRACHYVQCTTVAIVLHMVYCY